MYVMLFYVCMYMDGWINRQADGHIVIVCDRQTHR